MPWEQVGLDIEDNPVLPFVWNNRCFLFWIKLVQETQQEESYPEPPAHGDSLTNIPASTLLPNQAYEARLTIKAILCWSEYVNGKWQPARTSDPAEPLLCEEGLAVEDLNTFRAGLLLAAVLDSSNKGVLRISVTYGDWIGRSFRLYNTFASPVKDESNRQHFSPNRELHVDSRPSLKANYFSGDRFHTLIKTLGDEIVSSVAMPHHRLEGEPWNAPFFYEDSRHAFYVKTSTQKERLSEVRDLVFAAEALKPTGLSSIASLLLNIDKNMLSPHSQPPEPGFGIDNPSRVAHFVSEDANITTFIATPGTVSYGDQAIGPLGSEIPTSPTH